MRSKAWLAASVWLRLARLSPPASRVKRSRRLRDTLVAAPGLLAHVSVTEAVKFCPKLRHIAVAVRESCGKHRRTDKRKRSRTKKLASIGKACTVL